MRAVLRRFWYLLRRHRVDADLAEELSFHRAMAAREIEADGTHPREAALDAHRALGNTALTHDRVHDVWIAPWLQDLLREPRIAYRSLLKSPATSITTIVLIALVIGGNTTIYSAVHGLLTKPAPGVRADGLVTLDLLRKGKAVGAVDSYPNYQDYVAQSTSVRPLAAIGFSPFTLTLRDGSYAINGDLVTPNYFDTLGVHLAKGRTFNRDEGAPGSALIAVISDHLWREQFQSAADIVGRSIVLNGHLATIIGVAPPEFRGTILNESADVWVPLLAYAHLDSSGRASEATLDNRGAPSLAVMGRLAPGISLAEAQAEFDTISVRLQAAYPETNRDQSIRLLPYSMTAGGNSLLAESLPRFLAIFSVITLLTLLIVCANIANLMLARAVVRQREMAVRQSLGASRVRILRMLLIEGAILSVAAWVAAMLFAVWVSHAVIRLLQPPPGFADYIAFTVRPDWTVAAYAFVLALFAMIAFTIGPSLRAWRQQLLPWLKAGEQGILQGRSRLSAVLVVLQLAFSVHLGSERQPIEIIGVAPNALFHGSSFEDESKFIFLSEPQNPATPGLMRFYIRHRGSLDATAPAIRRALVAASASTAIVTIDSLTAALDSDVQPIRMVTMLLMAFALGSLLIAGIGQYAVVAFDMRRRTRELGVRIALGASARQILTGVIREGLRLTVAGLAFGFALSLAAGMVLRRLLYGVTPTDAWTYAGVFVLLACASLAACYLPARRAARVDPVQALRQE